MPLAFHASPPDGQWLNDPNALVATPTGFKLLVQHRADAPSYLQTGWGQLTSPNLLDWHWEGPAIEPGPAGWAYSGSVVFANGGYELFHTLHDPSSGLQHQVRLGAEDDSLRSWRTLPSASLPRARPNLRDPFVFRHADGWRMLLAQPCDWHEWTCEGASTLLVLASDDRVTWREAGRIGPWQPPGVMWEVPVLAKRSGRHLLLVSTVDRRESGASSSVMQWTGRFDGATFHPDNTDGVLADLGPDCYALMAGTGTSWPEEPPFVGWLSSWATAREAIWPRFAGGPVTLPRTVSVDRPGDPVHRFFVDLAAFARPCGSIPAAGMGVVTLDGTDAFRLELMTDLAVLVVAGDPRAGVLTVSRHAAPPFSWRMAHPGVLRRCAAREIHLFVDGPAVELFLEPDGRAVSVALPGRIRAASLMAGRSEMRIAWHAYRGAGDDPRRSALGVVP